MTTLYSIHDHKHRFALWAAARAAQRGLKGGTVQKLATAIEASSLPLFVKSFDPLDSISASEFDCMHKKWAQEIMASFTVLNKEQFTELTYGRAAKLIAIYIKCMIVNGGFEDSDLGKRAHPPIDALLLKSLSNKEVPGKKLEDFSKYAWTKADQTLYVKLIHRLREMLEEDQGFWQLEQFWVGYE